MKSYTELSKEQDINPNTRIRSSVHVNVLSSELCHVSDRGALPCLIIHKILFPVLLVAAATLWPQFSSMESQINAHANRKK